MTESEAIKKVKEFGLYHAIGDLPNSMLTVKAFEMAIKALEEIQQYRAIGTVEECREARERQRAKKPVCPYLKSLPTCPNCGEVDLQQENEKGNVVANYDFCPDCGQAIDWSETV